MCRLQAVQLFFPRRVYLDVGCSQARSLEGHRPGMLLVGFLGPRRGKIMMRYLKYAVLLGVLLFAAGNANAQWRVGVGVGPAYGGYYGTAPICDYGYYHYYP